MCGPAGVADAEASSEVGATQQDGQAFVDLPFLLAHQQVPVVPHGDPGAVISPVFQATQPLQQNRGRLPFSDVAYNPTHSLDLDPFVIERARSVPRWFEKSSTESA